MRANRHRGRTAFGNAIRHNAGASLLVALMLAFVIWALWPLVAGLFLPSA